MYQDVHAAGAAPRLPAVDTALTTAGPTASGPATTDPPTSKVTLVVEVPDHLQERARQLADDFAGFLSHSIGSAQVRTSVSVGAVRAGEPLPPARGLSIDNALRRVVVDGTPISLAYKEFELLAYLAARPGRIVSRAEVIESVWGVTDLPSKLPSTSRTVDTHVRRIRAKLGDHAVVLTTVRGQGYRFDPAPGVRYRSSRRLRSA